MTGLRQKPLSRGGVRELGKGQRLPEVGGCRKHIAPKVDPRAPRILP